MTRRSLATAGFVVLFLDPSPGHAATGELWDGADLGSDSFVELGSAQLGATGTTLSFGDPILSFGAGFYRVAVD
jgi:hypothetical protein